MTNENYVRACGECGSLELPDSGIASDPIDNSKTLNITHETLSLNCHIDLALKVYRAWIERDNEERGGKRQMEKILSIYALGHDDGLKNYLICKYRKNQSLEDDNLPIGELV